MLLAQVRASDRHDLSEAKLRALTSHQLARLEGERGRLVRAPGVNRRPSLSLIVPLLAGTGRPAT
jgi:hypothetical protein